MRSLVVGDSTSCQRGLGWVESSLVGARRWLRMPASHRMISRMIRLVRYSPCVPSSFSADDGEGVHDVGDSVARRGKATRERRELFR